MKSLAELLRDAKRLHQLRRLDEAARVYRELLRIKPNDSEIITSLGRLRFEQGRVDEAAAQLTKAAGINPENAATHYYLGLARTNQRRFSDAADAFGTAYGLQPDSAFALGEWAYTSRKIADWSSFAQQERKLTAAVRAGASTIDPFTFLQFSDNAADLLT
ncbi:MAG: tetratricopeptide repeat protein, partial [Xanthobacteraceae bacterium]